MKKFIVLFAIMFLVCAFILPLKADEANPNNIKKAVRGLNKQQGFSFDLADPNDKKNELSKHRKELQAFNRAAIMETRELMREDANSRDLVATLREQVKAELDLIRAVAAEEKAEKTVQVIEQIMTKRFERFDRILAQFQQRRARLGGSDQVNVADKLRESTRSRDRERINSRERSLERSSERSRTRTPRDRTRPQRPRPQRPSRAPAPSRAPTP